jgi:UDP-N-acetylglucosamine acyltransferase
MVHQTAIIHPRARLDATVQVGPYVVIDEGVTLGPHCSVGPHVHLTGLTVIGDHNIFHAGCVIGDAPQDLKYRGEPTGLRIGDHNVFREHCTVHRSNRPEADTVIGSHNYLMASSHVGHNSELGDHVILANAAMLGGHVLVQDRAFISATCMIHQFVRIGTLALMQGGSGVSKDLPPFTVARGNNTISGLNTIGLRRAGLKPEERLELKKLYHLLFRSRKRFREALLEAETNFRSNPARLMMEFVSASTRGIVKDIGKESGTADQE